MTVIFEILERWCKTFHSRHVFASVVVLVLVPIAHIANAASTFYNTTPEGVAIGGYDAVAYVTEKKPLTGNEAIAWNWSGATWHFSSEENRKAFKGNPWHYAPAYGGWCAMGMALGSVVEVDFVDGWALRGGRLYFNVSKGLKRRWMRGARRFVQLADGWWSYVEPAIVEDRVHIYQKSDLPELYLNQ